MNSVTSKEACEIAATKLGLSYTSYTFYGASRNRPHGCIYASNDWLAWNDYPLHWNDASVPCGTKQGSNEIDCLCTSGRASIIHFLDVANYITTQITCRIICRLIVYILDRMSRY